MPENTKERYEIQEITSLAPPKQGEKPAVVGYLLSEPGIGQIGRYTTKAEAEKVKQAREQQDRQSAHEAKPPVITSPEGGES